MPQALGFLLPGVFGVGGSVALVTAAGSLTWAGIAINIAGSLALSALTAPKVPDQAKPDNIQLNTKNATGPRFGHFGKVLVGGSIVFHRAESGTSYRVIVHGHGQISRVLEYQLDGTPVLLDGNGDINADDPPYMVRNNTTFGSVLQPRVRLLSRDGSAPSTAYSEITAIWPEWTTDHRLDGLWTTMIRAQSVAASKQRKSFPFGEPSVKVKAETAACYDPRTETSAFTENMALAIREYVALPHGFNRPDVFDEEDIITEADICDRDVALAAGGTEKLYRIGGSYMLNERPQDVLGRMLAACAGRIRLKPNGKVRLKVGAWTAPEFTLGFADILEVQEVSPGPDMLDRYNELPARFNAQDLGFVEVDAEPWLDATRVAEDREVRPGPDKPLILCPSHRQARQCMKIHTERDNPRQIVTLLCKPKALPAIYEDTIAVDVPQLGLSGYFEVSRHALSFEKALLRSVALVLRKVDPAAYNLALAEQGQVQELPEPQTSAGVPVPQNVVAGGAGVQVSANTFVAGISIGWQAPPSSALTPVVHYRGAGSGGWKGVAVTADVTSVQMPGLTEGGIYDVSVAFETPGGVIGDEVVVEDVVAAASTTAPAPPSVLAVTDAGGGAALVELTAAAAATLWKTQIYRDAVLIATSYADPGTAISITDVCGTGTFNWTARSIDVSVNPSETDAGPVTATIA
ncbi:fibronectin type III domain-containing protein [Primorskyibacter sp. 2E107]|uniref:fibronectin type III domain-containing protein n=1 Tax=Primorskyibacter sp. 2E107 TaxID=3403458 RepID=UPI003AF412CA